MKKSIEELTREGEEIARRLGNGAIYIGPQLANDKLVYHMFNDSAVTDTSFAAKTFKEAKQVLIERRKRFGAKLPNF